MSPVFYCFSTIWQWTSIWYKEAYNYIMNMYTPQCTKQITKNVSCLHFILVHFIFNDSNMTGTIFCCRTEKVKSFLSSVSTVLYHIISTITTWQHLKIVKLMYCNNDQRTDSHTGRWSCSPRPSARFPSEIGWKIYLPNWNNDLQSSYETNAGKTV